MKKLFLLLSFTVGSCTANSEQRELENTSKEELTEYPDNFIYWKDILDQVQETYFVYVFSYDCYYCKQVKSNVIKLYNSCDFPVFFVEYSKEIPVKNNVGDTIGECELSTLFIKGTPSLLLINNGYVSINVGGKNAVDEIINLYLKNE